MLNFPKIYLHEIWWNGNMQSKLILKYALSLSGMSAIMTKHAEPSVVHFFINFKFISICRPRNLGVAASVSVSLPYSLFKVICVLLLVGNFYSLFCQNLMGNLFSLNYLFNLAKAALTKFWKGHFQGDVSVKILVASAKSVS